MSILALFIQGDIYPSGKNDPAAVVAAITGSKLTTPILGLFHVNCSSETCPNEESPPGSQDADITFNDSLIIRGGKYVGDPSWPDTIKSLRSGQVNKIFASFGGYGVPDYGRIGTIISKYGTGPNTPLHDNFACLKDTLKIDGIDFDLEDGYNKDTVAKFAAMLLKMELEITFCPYTDHQFWSDCIKAVGAANVSWVNLQCYAGGKNNNPADWTNLGVPIAAGVCANCCCPDTKCSPQQVNEVYSLWTTGKGSVGSECWKGTAKGAVTLAGGFIWNYGDIAHDFVAYIDAMAAGLAHGGEV
jgi:hypothetical protein